MFFGQCQCFKAKFHHKHNSERLDDFKYLQVIQAWYHELKAFGQFDSTDLVVQILVNKLIEIWTIFPILTMSRKEVKRKLQHLTG